MKKAVIIIARNEGAWPVLSSENFRRNFSDIDIIGIDDGGNNEWPEYAEVIKTKGGIGVGMCRRLGFERAKEKGVDVAIITDAHVFYELGCIKKAWELAEKGYIVNSTTRSLSTQQNKGNGRFHYLPNHKTKNVTTAEGMEVGLIGGVYFMRVDVALEIIGPTPSHGYNEQIMTCGAFAMGHPVYAFPSMVFSHLYKQEFNYSVSHSGQSRNKLLLDWWFFGGRKPSNTSNAEINYYRFVQGNRKLNKHELKNKILEMNLNLQKYASNKRI